MTSDSRPTTGAVGVIGGMGPMATVEFYRHVVQASSATTDQDHLPVLIWGDPRIPDRSDAITSEGHSPVPMLRLAAETLIAAGAQRLVVACNTAHVFLDSALAGLGVPLVSLIESTADAVAGLPDCNGRVAILGTDGTVESRVYQMALADRGIECFVPSTEIQAKVMRAVRELKASRVSKAEVLLAEIVGVLKEQGVGVLVAACTELPDAITRVAGDALVVDPMEVVATTLVKDYELERAKNV